MRTLPLFLSVLAVASCGKADPAASPRENPAPAAAAPEMKPPPKDPLAYRIHALPAGSLALFEGWTLTPIPSDDAHVFETHPEGKENDFQMLVAMATPDARDLANLFQEGPALLLQLIPGARTKGDARDCTYGGDPAQVRDYEAASRGRTLDLRLICIRKKDVAVVVLGLGTADAFATYGRALDIMAQSITLTESPADPRLTGTWTRNHTYVSGTFSAVSGRSLTFYPNGTFSRSSFSSAGGASAGGATSEGANRGRVVRRGDILTFHSDDGKTSSSEYEVVDGPALKIDGETYFKQ